MPRCRSLIVCALLLPATALAAPAQQARDGSVAGRVVDAASGKPVGGVLVTLGGAGAALIPSSGPGVHPGPPRILTAAAPGAYRIVATSDVDAGDWFDPTVLERLLPAASAITVAGVEKTTRDLVIR